MKKSVNKNKLCLIQWGDAFQFVKRNLLRYIHFVKIPGDKCSSLIV